MSFLNGVGDSIREQLAFLDRPFVVGALTIGLAIYAALAPKRVGKSVLRLFSNKLFKVLMVLLISYVAVKSITLALALTVAFMASVMYAHKHSMREELIEYWAAVGSIVKAPHPKHVDFADEGVPMGMEMVNNTRLVQEEDSSPRGYDEMSRSEWASPVHH